jgi:acetyltransferase-like isoleucine patch superfamily enzyme
MNLPARFRFFLNLSRGYYRMAWLGWILRCKGIFAGYYIEPSFRTSETANVSIQPGVVIQRRAVFSMKTGSVLKIGRNTRIGSDAVIAVQEKVDIGNHVLIAARCFISDQNHAFRDPSRPVMHQGVTTPNPVSIGDGSWLGINVCIMPGVNLGRNCVVGANSVVTKSYPDFSILAGAPAKPIGSVAPSSGTGHGQE